MAAPWRWAWLVVAALARPALPSHHGNRVADWLPAAEPLEEGEAPPPPAEAAAAGADAAALDEASRRADAGGRGAGRADALTAYYGGDASVLRLSRRMNRGVTDFGLHDRIVAALLGPAAPKRFVIAVLGGRVTSGEGRWASAAWPRVLERRLKPFFTSLGVDFEVRSAAAASRNRFPDAFCLGALLGPDVDVVIREWSPKGMSEGLPEALGWLDAGQRSDLVWNVNISDRTNRNKQASRVPFRELAASEVFLRTVFGLRTRPALQFLSLDSDGGDNASSLRHAVEKGGVFYDAYRRYSTSFFSGREKRATFPTSKAPISAVLLELRAYDHLRKVRQAKLHDGGSKDRCKDKDVKVCPIDADKPDGFHARAAYDGFDASHKSWAQFVGGGLYDKRGKYLSHLGHELVGNQVAYHYLQYANTTLLRLLRSRTVAADVAALVARSAKARNVKSPLPHAAICTGPLCDKHLSRPKCAYSSLPKHAAPDVGDLVSNASAVTRWSNVAVGGGKHDASCGDLDRAAACGDETSLECFSHEMACSHGGQTRAFEGFAGSGPLQLDVDFARRAVLISSRRRRPAPVTTANWKTELKVTVEGAPCGPPACVAVGGDGDPTQSLYIDLAKVPDCDECKTCWMLQPVHVDLEVSPLPELGADVCALRDGACAAAGDWAHYDLGCTPRPNRKDACWRPLLRNVYSGELSDVRNPQMVRALVNSIVVL
ncbi:hypothetical protein JL721_5080 [Aureococcus anophagefferens]|nr:hypothetical protein JL721_5080 [Aureococcus anophagefferens]